MFIAPLLVGYECGVWWLGPEAVRNGADVWLRGFLDSLGFGQHYLLPILTTFLLLSWHHASRKPWRVSAWTLFGMLIECTLLAFALRFFVEIQGRFLPPAVDGQTPAAHQAVTMGLAAGAGRIVGFLGAGVYEELLFRMMLLPPVIWTMKAWGAKRVPGAAIALLVTSLLFAFAHYVGPHGEPFLWLDRTFWFGFTFRFAAGMLFGTLFVCRGFGIAAGTHAGYDILVGIV
jgi:membrane protease YdiL (CAAX protease family)